MPGTPWQAWGGAERTVSLANVEAAFVVVLYLLRALFATASSLAVKWSWVSGWKVPTAPFFRSLLSSINCMTLFGYRLLSLPARFAVNLCPGVLTRGVPYNLVLYVH